MRAIISLFIAAIVVAPSPAAAQQREPELRTERAIEKVSGDLYRFHAGPQHSLFLVTPEGIVVVDPLGLNTALWLNEQFAERFPGVPVKYVVFTHHHAERAAGAAVFKGASTIGHEKFRSALAYSSGTTGVSYEYVTPPQRTFADRYSFEIGGKTIDLVHTGSFHSRDLIVVLFRSERVLLAVDPPPIGKVPFSFGPQSPGAVVRWLDIVAPLPFDTAMLGDGSLLARDAFTGLAAYLSRMRSDVLAAYERGRSLRTTIDRLPLDAYKTLPHYRGRGQQISEMYRHIRFVQAEIILSGIANYFPERAPEFCAGFERCTGGGAAPAGTVAGVITFGRRIGLQAEVAISDQFWSTRGRPLYDEETVMRPFRSSLLVRFNLTRSRNITLLVGGATVKGDVAGINRVQGAFIPVGGQHAIADATEHTGMTGGIELSKRIGSARLVVPLRVTQSNGPRPQYWPSRLNASAGVGLSIRLFRLLE